MPDDHPQFPPQVFVALYQGVSGISKSIRWITRSDYSHAAVVNALTGETYEAWHNPGHFRKTAHPTVGHAPGTVIHFFAPVQMRRDVALDVMEQCEEWAAKEVRYDFRNVLRFVTRTPRKGEPSDRLFCSEAVALAFAAAGYPLQIADASLIAPGHLAWSPVLRRVRPMAGWWRGI